MSDYPISIQSVTINHSYDEEEVYASICRHMDHLNIAADLQPGMTVLLKPNLVLAKKPEYAATTHPVLIKAVVRWLLEQKITRIIIADSPGGLYQAEYLKSIYSACGLTCPELAPYLNQDFGFETVPTRKGFANHSFPIIHPIQKADYIINLPKLKTHAMTGLSGGIKNLFGSIPGLQKPQMHYRWPQLPDFSNMLLELAQTVHPDLTIIDAIIGMEGNGPTGGTPKNLGLILASKDVYTQDWFAASCIGLEPSSVAMLQLAKEQGLIHPDAIQLAGDALPEHLPVFAQPDTKRLDFGSKIPPLLRKPVLSVLKRLLKSYPQVDTSVCIGCGKCMESCPAHIITIREKKAHFPKKGCISCFCCQEMCSVKAISVKKAL